MPMLTVKSDASGTARWGFVYTYPSGEGELVYGQLSGGDADVHVPFYEMAAVHECVCRHAPTWGGYLIRFGVDSAPVANALNTGTSRDPSLMRLLRTISNAHIHHSFDIAAVHVTRNQNQLADALTRHITVQDLHQFLAHENFDAKECGDTPVACRIDSQLTNSGRWSLQLGRRKPCAGSLERRRTWAT